MSKILVDVMPITAEQCPFAEYIAMTSKNSCRLKSGMYSRCDLECERVCDKLTTRKNTVGTHRDNPVTLEDVRNSKCTEFVCHYINESGKPDFIILSKEQILNYEWAQFYFNGGYKNV